MNVAALELISDSGQIGLGFIQTLFLPLPDQAEIERVFATEVWPGLEGQQAIALVHRVSRPRGGNQRAYVAAVPRGAAGGALGSGCQGGRTAAAHACSAAAATGSRPMPAGSISISSDDDFQALFAHAAAIGYRAFKIKVGHPDFERDLHRLALLKQVRARRRRRS